MNNVANPKGYTQGSDVLNRESSVKPSQPNNKLDWDSFFDEIQRTLWHDQYMIKWMITGKCIFEMAAIKSESNLVMNGRLPSKKTIIYMSG